MVAHARPELAYSVRDVASMLRCSPGHVRDMVRRGLLRRIDTGGRNWSIAAADVHALTGADIAPHDVLSSAHERDDLARELRRWLLEGHALAERLEQL